MSSDNKTNEVRSIWAGPRYLRRIAVALSLLTAAFALRVWHDQQKPKQLPADSASIERRAQANPRDPQAQLDLAGDLLKRGHISESAAVYSAGRELAPADPRPLVGLGMIAVKRNDIRGAESLFAQSLRLAPSDADVWLALAELQQRNREFGPAIDSYKRVTELRSRDAFAWRQMGTIEQQLKLFARAGEHLARAAVLAPNDPLTLLRLARIQEANGDLPHAKQTYDRLLAIEPRQADGLLGRAGATIKLDPSPSGLQHAEDDVNGSLSTHPSARGHLLLGQIKMVRRDRQGAIDEFRRCLQMDPSQTEAHSYLSQAYSAAGKPELARKSAAAFEASRAKQAGSGR